MKINLINEFHKTRATLLPRRIKDGRFKGFYKISASAAKRAKDKLCGVNGCTCGGNFGERGGAHVDLIDIDYDNNFIIKI